MRLDFWNKRDCECAAYQMAAEISPPPSKEAERVCRMSPARLLANSLTDPETRGEWARSEESASSVLGRNTIYRNAARDLTVSKWWGVCGYSVSEGLTTPFTLSDAEKEIVKAALDAFDRHERDKREAKALARLTAAREGLKPDRAETPKSGSTAKRRKPGAKARAQGDSQ